jgi:exopolysaccharide biosynthesis protein
LLLAARAGGRFAVLVRLMPVSPREAVGGFPVLARDSTEVAGLDSAGAPTFAPVRHPRTLVGVAAGGRRLLLMTIDGRQEGYSAGTTNRETARIALALGATEAINLDGGGSTTMVVARPTSDSVRYEVVNKPSDPQGERPVGNALLIVRLPRPGAACPAFRQ